MKRHLDGYQTAIFVLKTLLTYEGETSRQLSRFRISRKTLRIIAARSYLRDSFVDDVGESLRELGWIMFEFGDHYCFIRMDRIENWQRIASKRIREDLRKAHDQSSDFDFDVLAAEIEKAVEPEELIEE